MGQTLVEKIISKSVGKSVSAGDIVVCPSDFTFIHDFSGPLTLDQLEKIDHSEPEVDGHELAVFFDHASPSSTKSAATDQGKLRTWAQENGATLYDVGSGISHQVIAEEVASPGMIILGADSHTVMAGAFGCFATGMGSTDIAAAMATGKSWLKIPETIRVDVHGELDSGVFAKDLNLKFIGEISTSGANFQSIEWGGEAIRSLPMNERLVLTNMGIEAGATNAVIASDQTTKEYLKQQGRADEWVEIFPDEDADYDRKIEIDADELEPTVSVPHHIDNTSEISELLDEDVEIDQIYMGSCTNGRFEDFQVFADILEDHDVHPDVRVVCTPASKEVHKKGMKTGLWESLIDAGAVVNSPGCGACPGVQTGILGDDETCLASINRNYEGRMGNPEASIYLGSPATCGISAVKGRISDPREYYHE